jgi:hypothetical protein
MLKLAKIKVAARAETKDVVVEAADALMVAILNQEVKDDQEEAQDEVILLETEVIDDLNHVQDAPATLLVQTEVKDAQIRNLNQQKQVFLDQDAQEENKPCC